MPSWLKRVGIRKQTDQPGSPRDAPLNSLRYVVLDTELTSLDHRTNRLLAIGAIAMQGPSIQLGEQFYRVVNPEVAIPSETVLVHRLRAEDIASGERPHECLADLRHFLEGAVLVGHFLDIELKILRKEMSQTGHGLANLAVDTAKVHYWMLRHGKFSEDLPIKLERLALAGLAQFYNLHPENAHHALSDAFVTARIWQRMLFALQSKKILTLDKLLRIAGA